MCGHGLIQRGQALVSYLFHATNGCESGRSRWTDARQVWGSPRYCELIMDFGEEGDECWRWARWRPGKNHSSSLLRDGSSGWDHSSPSSLTAFVMARMSSSSALGLALREYDNGQRAGSVTEPANSSASETASFHRLSSNSPSLMANKIMSLAAAEGRWSCWAKRTGETLSLWWWRGTRALSWCEHAKKRLLDSSAPLFFPHRSLGGIKQEGARGGVALWKESYSRVQRGKTEALTVRAFCPAERSVSMGFPQTWHTQRECHQRAGDSRTFYNDGASFAIALCLNLLF